MVQLLSIGKIYDCDHIIIEIHFSYCVEQIVSKYKYHQKESIN